MKLTFLGTCSGTEPMPGYRHVSFTIEAGGGVYWFDAGEGCSYTAHLMGIDLLSVRAIFISHAHLDHIGGLPNLLWNIRKLTLVSEAKPHKLTGKTVEVFIPDLEAWEGILKMLRRTEGGFALDFALKSRRCSDGEIFNDGHVRVTALHNQHMGTPGQGRPWMSYSFRVESAAASLVYSGDVAGVEELAGLIGDGCGLLLMETGHHRVADVCGYLRDSSLHIGQVAFIHHGRAVLADPDGQARTGSEILGRQIIIARDGMTLKL